MIRITRLTAHNIRALQELLTDEEHQQVTLGQSVATFHMEQSLAQQLVVSLQQRAAHSSGTATHPYKSLLAVARKVNATTEAAR